ncbi:PREDICTED: taste receptor type 2 member 9-like [Nanorana parkeri]|uniref:taste receptor type 2 member 9-like n=1 Tax=Nanorana parkeri TaxID=125878 RepID=UPI000854C077|nr:PREDICTED: taste receptor type 2 member 9-like [Nanorana parkeri]
MWSVADIIRLFSLFFNLVSGLTLNSYIIAVYVREWRKKKGLNVSDKIVLLLALTGITFQCTVTIERLTFFLGSLSPHSRRRNIYIFAFHIFLMYEIFWNTAWLSAYYCLKLVKCSHHVFLQVKKRLSSSITQLLIVSLVGLFLLTLPLPWTIDINYRNMTSDPSGNRHDIHVDVRYVPLYMVLGSLLPFLLCFICIGLSVMSLLSHVQQIRQNSSQFSSSPQLEGHLRAVRTMILQVCLCLALYLAALSMLLFSPYLGMIEKVIFLIIITSYSSVQAVISIQGNPKLRNRPPTHDTAMCSK